MSLFVRHITQAGFQTSSIVPCDVYSTKLSNVSGGVG